MTIDYKQHRNKRLRGLRFGKGLLTGAIAGGLIFGLSGSKGLPGASYHVDWTKQIVYTGQSFSGSQTFARNSVGQAQKVDLTWLSYATNTMRCTDKGILVEEIRTNQLRNNTGAGAVAGTPGTLPTYTNIFKDANISYSVINGTTTRNGLKTWRVRFSGTPGASGSILIQLEQNGQLASVAGPATGSVFVALAAGSTTNLGTCRMIVQEYTSGNAYVASSAAGAFVLGSSFVRPSDFLTLVGGTNHVRPFIQIDVTSGQAIDFTMDIGVPQIEFGRGATSPIETTAAAVQRLADNDQLASATTYLSPTQGTIYVEFEAGPDTVSFRRLWRYRISGTDAFELAIGTDSKLAFSVTVGGVTQATIVSTNAVVAGNIYKVAVRWQAANFAMRVSGLGAQPANVVTGTVPVGAGTFGMGNDGNAGSYANVYLRSLATYLVAQNDNQLNLLVA